MSGVDGEILVGMAESSMNPYHFTVFNQSLGYIAVVKPKYVSSHDSVYLNVAKGLFPAGGGVKRTFNNIPKETRKQFKVLWTTDPYTLHAIAARPDIESETKLHCRKP